MFFIFLLPRHCGSRHMFDSELPMPMGQCGKSARGGGMRITGRPRSLPGKVSALLRPNHSTTLTTVVSLEFQNAEIPHSCHPEVVTFANFDTRSPDTRTQPTPISGGLRYGPGVARLARRFRRGCGRQTQTFKGLRAKSPRADKCTIDKKACGAIDPRCLTR